MTKVAEFPDATRITVVGKNGLVYEDYTLFKGGCEVHVQDDGKSVKVFPLEESTPTKRTLVGKIGQMQLRNPWTWPLIALSVLLVVLLVGTLAAVLGGCAAQGGYSSGTSDPGEVKTSTNSGDFTVNNLTVNGRTVTCITWASWDFINEAMKSGMDCLEPEAE